MLNNATESADYCPAPRKRRQNPDGLRDCGASRTGRAGDDGRHSSRRTLFDRFFGNREVHFRKIACGKGGNCTATPPVPEAAEGRISQRGFTLFELIVVLFIAGLVVAVAIVATGRMHDKAVFNEEARRIFQTLKHAREVSLFERRDVTFRIDEEEKRYWLDYGGEKKSDVRVVGKEFRLTGKDVFFFPKGNSSGGLVKIEDEKGQGYAIKVDPVLGSPSISRF